MQKVYTIFSELLKLCPRYHFDKAVERHEGDRYVKTFTTWQQFITILYSQITQKDSLRDIETGLSAQASRWYHLGLTGVHKSTLSEQHKISGKGILIDERIALQGPLTKKLYPQELRRIMFCDEERKKTLTFLTNNFKLAASTIARIYKSRWQIELFFKWIKQNLKIKSFLGTSKNAVLDPNLGSHVLLPAADLHQVSDEIQLFFVLSVPGYQRNAI